MFMLMVIKKFDYIPKMFVLKMLNLFVTPYCRPNALIKTVHH